MKTAKNIEKIEKEILREKLKGTPDIEIGAKLGVSYRFIEKVVTRYYGATVSVFPSEKKIKEFYPKVFSQETTTLWSFKNRGKWATHSNEYRGNWSPYIPRNIILLYSYPGDTVLDYFCGGGTTAIEAKLLGRKCIAIDINEKAVELSKKNVSFEIYEMFSPVYEPEIKVGDARNLSFIKDNSIDLICAHPPYANIIHYTDGKEGDLSFLNPDSFLKEMEKVAKESYRVLKPGRKCALLIGDLRRKKHVFPLGFKLIDVFQKNGFLLKELIIKRQHNCKTTGFWYENSLKYNFLLLAHEYLPVFEKPGEKLEKIQEEWVPYDMIQKDLKFHYKKKLSFLETSTVWIFPSANFEELLNKNVISRYSKNRRYKVFTFSSMNRIECIFSNQNKRNVDLLYFKLPEFLNFSLPEAQIETYLKTMRDKVFEEILSVKKGGYIAIETKDVRTENYLNPMGKEIVKTFEKNPNMWLKEIIIVSSKDILENSENSKSPLKIAHHYLTIFERI